MVLPITCFYWIFLPTSKDVSEIKENTDWMTDGRVPPFSGIKIFHLANSKSNVKSIRTQKKQNQTILCVALAMVKRMVFCTWKFTKM